MFDGSLTSCRDFAKHKLRKEILPCRVQSCFQRKAECSEYAESILVPSVSRAPITTAAFCPWSCSYFLQHSCAVTEPDHGVARRSCPDHGSACPGCEVLRCHRSQTCSCLQCEVGKVGMIQESCSSL